MNATFNIHRLGLTISKELQEKYLTILGTVGIIMLAYLFIWALSQLGGDPVPAYSRAKGVVSILSVVTCIAPFILYKNENRRMEGVFYAISPASTLEKTISMLVICSLIFPITATVLLLSLDSLITLFPFKASYTGSIWGTVFSYRDYMHILMDSSMVNPENQGLVDRIYSSMSPLMISPFVGLILGQSPFVFLNMLFRKNKIGYTLLIFFGILTIMMVASIVSVINIVDTAQTGEIPGEEELANWIETWVKAFLLIVSYILPVVFWVLTYFRIRRIQY